MKRQLKRKHQQASESSKKKAKIQSSQPPSTSEAIPNFSRDSTHKIPTNGDKQEVQQSSRNIQELGQRESILGNDIPYFISP